MGAIRRHRDGGLNFLGSTAITALVSKHTADGMQGLALGAISAVGSLCAIVGPLLFGDLYNYLGAAPYNFPEAPFLVGAALVLISIAATLAPGALPKALRLAAGARGPGQPQTHAPAHAQTH